MSLIYGILLKLFALVVLFYFWKDKNSIWSVAVHLRIEELFGLPLFLL